MPFLEAGWRLAVRAVKGAGLAFTGAKRKPLTEEANGLGAGFLQEGFPWMARSPLLLIS